MNLIKDLGMIYPTSETKTKRHYGLYECKCGKEARSRMKNSKTKEPDAKQCFDCGRKETSVKNKSHGHNTRLSGKTRMYHSWDGMKQRCLNEKSAKYGDYGGRGIKMCKEWHEFSAFMEWAELNGYKSHLEIDRIDNDGDYSPDNCRWADRKTQCANRRKKQGCTSRYIGVNLHTEGVYAARCSVNNKTVYIGTYDNQVQAAVERDAYIINNNLYHKLNFNNSQVLGRVASSEVF